MWYAFSFEVVRNDLLNFSGMIQTIAASLPTEVEGVRFTEVSLVPGVITWRDDKVTQRVTGKILFATDKGALGNVPENLPATEKLFRKAEGVVAFEGPALECAPVC